MQDFCLDQPGIAETEEAQSSGGSPAHHPDLIGLNDVFSPVADDDGHESIESGLVPFGVQLVVERVAGDGGVGV